jgi:hypothetical protein
MSQQIQITGGAKVRNLQDVIIGTSGVLSSVAFDVANGVPRLDVNGKILVSQLPNSVMEYKGTWSAATNTPTLANGTGNQGDVYLCNVAGTVDFGAGAIAFVVGDQVIYSGSIWQRASGATGTVTSVGITESGDSLNITGSPITTSGTINIGFNGTNLQYVNGAGNLTTFPDLTGYVPYTGATANVDLGTFNLTADVITGATGSFASNGGSNTFAINHSSGAGIALNITKGGSGEGLYINKTSGSGNAATIIGTLNATTLVKSGGTSSQFLKADGTVDSTAYQSALTLTTTGTSGAATLVGATLNIPNYANIVTSVFGRTGAVVATNGDYYIGTTAVQATSANQSLTGISAINFVSQASDFASISTTISGSATYFDFNLGDDNGDDEWRWRFSPTGGVTYEAMRLVPTTNTTANLIVSGTITGSNLSGTNTGDQTLASLGAQAQLNGTGFVKASGTTISYDNSTYLTTSAASSTYLPLAGGTLTGPLNINVSSGTAMNVAGNAIFRGDTGVGTPRQLIITSGGSTPVYLEAKGYGANYQTDFGIRTYNNVGTSFEVFYADSSGRVGINQVSPSYQLDVNGTFRAVGDATFSSTVTAVGYSKFWNGTTGLLIGAFSAGAGYGALYSTGVTPSTTNFALATNGASTVVSGTNDVSLAINNGGGLFINSLGNIGINTSSPTPRDAGALVLELYGTSSGRSSIKFTNSTSGTGATDGMWMGYDDGLNFTMVNNEAGYIALATSNTTRLTIASTGAATFSSSVTATSESTLFKEGFIVKATTTGGGGSQPAYTYYTAAGSKRWSTFLNVGDDKFYIANASNSELFTITQGGNVGIGATTPPHLLSLYKASGDTYVSIYKDTTDFLLGVDSAGLLRLFTSGSNSMSFWTNSTERMRIKSNGIINFSNVPTSASGLSAGDVYKSAGVLMIV